MLLTLSAFSALASLAISGLSASSAAADHLLNLAPNPSFENTEQGTNGWYPAGIVVEGKQPLSIVDDTAHTGTRCMKVEVGPAGATNGTIHFSSYNAGEGEREAEGFDGVRGARTIAYRLDRDIRSIKASVWLKTEAEQDMHLKVKWYSRNGRRRPVELTHIDAFPDIIARENGWSKYGSVLPLSIISVIGL